MATEVDELLDLLFQMIDEAKNMPFSSGGCVVERDKALDLIDEIRGQLPMELAEAKKLRSAREEYLASAKREGELILKQAEEKAKQLLAEDELLAKAKRQGEELVAQAKRYSKELRQAANTYCEDAMRRTEEAVAEAHDEIKKARSRFRAAAAGAEGTAPQSEQGQQREIFDAETQG